MIRLEVTDGRFYRLPPFQPASLLWVERLELAAMDDLHVPVVMIHTAVAEVDHDLFRNTADAFQQNLRLFKLGGQGMAIVGIARERSRAHHQAAAMGHRNTGFHPELIGLTRFPFSDALNLRRMQGVELVLVLRPLGANALGASHQGVQPRERQG